MQPDLSIRHMSRAEQETETEATRLMELVEDALASVAIRNEIDSLESVADRIERAARDLSVAIRELAGERRVAHNASK